MRRRTLLLLAVAATLAALAAVMGAARSLARPALGFVAKTVCSDVFVGGFTPAQALSGLPDEPIARVVRTRIDMEERRVRASVPLIARREARYREGVGCTLDSLALSVERAVKQAPVRAAASQARHSTSDDRWTSASRGAAPTPDTAALDDAMDDAFSEPGGGSTRRTRAIVVVRGGRVIAERYAAGFGPDTRFPGWSMTKSVIGALVGVLVGEGGLEPGIDALRPEWRGSDDPRATITLHHLLQMSSGLDFDESYTPGGGATRMLFASADVAAVAAESPLRHAPGARFAYSSATTNLISALVRETIGSDTAYLAFPQRALFDRVGMQSAIIEPDASGTLVGSSFMYATARDWARFGQLFLDDGVWDGERILPEGWVAYSTTPAPAAPLGQYGAHWWLNAGAPGDSTRRLWPALPTDVYSATGFQGQYVMIVPSHDLVVVRLGLTADERMWDMSGFVARVIRALAGSTPSDSTAR